MYKLFVRLLAAPVLVIVLLFGGFAPSPVMAQGEAQDDQNVQNKPIVDRFEDMGWEFQAGDWILANVKENTIQFVRSDESGHSAKIRIGSGINNGKKIAYLGMTYNPATPEGEWEIRSKHQQSVYWIFGSKLAKEQLFLRLYEVRGEQRIHTRYGIHTTPEIETIIKNGGFGSYGCLITRYDLLKKIEELFALNEGMIRVKTVRE